MALAKRQFLTVNEVAEYLDVSRMTVINLINSGELASFKVGAQYRVTQKQVEEYLQKNKNVKN